MNPNGGGRAANDSVPPRPVPLLPPPPPPPPPAAPQSGFKPHESTLGDLPALESAPPSGNLPSSSGVELSALLLNTLPPPPPPPSRVRTTVGLSTTMATPPLPPSSTTTTTTSSSGSRTVVPLPPPPPPPPKVVVQAPVSANMDRSNLDTRLVGPPPPPPKIIKSSSSTTSTTTTTTTVFSVPPTTATAASTTSPPATTSGSTQDGTGPPTDWDMHTGPPLTLPLTTFMPSTPSLIARRYTHCPILVIATEGASQLAWKNGLHLTDLFQGILASMETTTTSSNNNNNNTSMPLPRFRSVNGTLTLDPSIVHQVQFMAPEQLQPYNYDAAHGLLQRSAQLQEQDGNLVQELMLLEDRVESLVPDWKVTSSEEEEERKQNPDAIFSSPSSAEQRVQVAEEAFQLTSPMNIPWLTRFQYALDASTNALPHELVHTPALILYVCSTREVEHPVHILQELMEASQVFLPDCFQNGCMDPSPESFRREVLVLHDQVDGPANLEDSSLRQVLQTQFGPQATLLKINSVPYSVARALAAEETRDLWGGRGQLGTRLSVNDVSLLRKYLQTLVISSLLPALEHRIAQLNIVVSERKKGVRNLVKSFWRATPKTRESITAADTEMSTTTSTTTLESSIASSNGAVVPVQYRYDSIESQTRLLADTLLLVKDYEGALSTYRLIRDDFKNDNALIHYASVQELIGLCMYQLDPYLKRRDVFSHWETALLSYTRAAEEERQQRMALGVGPTKDVSARPTTAPHATRLATRLCLIMATAAGETLTQGREVEVADLLASVSSHESSLGAAVLLEQASAFYYQTKLYRKYAFHMLMSGHMFRTANQDHHAIRCFTSALYIYRYDQWKELFGHLKSALAAQLYAMGRCSVALVLYASLVQGSSGNVSAKSQQKFLSHLLDICLQYPKQALVGADRLAALAARTTTTTTNQHHSDAEGYLDRIVQVIQYTPGTSRVLELPYMNLPRVVDSSVKIWTHAEQHFLIQTAQEDGGHANEATATNDGRTLGMSGKGEDAIWNELELVAMAEWNALDTIVRGLDEATTTALSKIADPQHRHVIAQIDKEKQSKVLMERNRRQGNIKPKPAVRAMEEPIFCDFVLQNPMAVDIQVTQIQLVARMVNSEQVICTNQDAIRFKDDSTNEHKTWTFSSTDLQQFTVAEFLRSTQPSSKSSKPGHRNPFFVVTKQDIELTSGAQVVVSAGLTPLVQGDLEILGVRFKLQDQVWVYHNFDIPGPLLNDTRSNRANRVRGEPLLLKSTVSVGMPCITAELVKRSASAGSPVIPSDDGPLLEGQISLWNIRLRNIGNAAACQAMLKTNLPWINISSKSPSGLLDEELEAKATSHCVGPTGTLMTLPLMGTSLKEAGVIHPGETVDIPVQIRTSGSGKRNFYMLYRYVLYEKSNSKVRTRWLRKMYEVPVFPSLALSAGAVPSQWKPNEHILSVQLTNYRTDRPTDLYVTLDSVAMASRKYKLEIIPGQFSTSDQIANLLQIGWQERLTVHYRVLPLEAQDSFAQLSECPFNEDANASRQKCATSNALNFMCLERACETFESAWTSHQNELLRAEHDQEGGGNHPRSIASIRRANTMDSTNGPEWDALITHPTSIGKLCPPETSSSKIHLLCRWRAILGDEVIHGEHHLRALSIRPKSIVKGCPIHVTAKYPTVLHHNFDQGPAVVPVSVTLRNQLLEAAVSFSLVGKLNPSFEFIGLGELRMSLQPDESMDVPFDVLIPREGIHNLQSLQVQVRQGGEGGGDDRRTGTNKDVVTLYDLSQQWLLHVSDSATVP